MGMVLLLERVRSWRAIAALKDGVWVPPCAEGWRFELFDGEAVEGFSRGVEGLLVVAEVLHVPGV